MKRRRGFSIIEFMVAVALASVVMLGAVYVTVSSSRSKTEAMGMARLNQVLRDTALIVSRDLVRAGAWEPMGDAFRTSIALDLKLSSTTKNTTATVTGAPTEKSDADEADDVYPIDFSLISSYLNQTPGAALAVVDTEGNVYSGAIATSGNSSTSMSVVLATTFPTDTLIAGSWVFLPPTRGVDLRDSSNASVSGTSGTATCIVFRYDEGRDGGIADRGYKYDSNDGAVDVRKTGGGCADGAAWEGITDPNEIFIESFTITSVTDVEAGIVGTAGGVGTLGLLGAVRSYEIRVRGCLARDRLDGTNSCDASGVKEAIEVVRVRNDDIYTPGEQATLKPTL